MIRIIAYQIAENINIRKFKSEYTGNLITSSSFELFYQQKEGYIYILNYGVVVFANIEEIERSNFVQHLKTYSNNILDTRHQEDFIIEKSENKNLNFSYNSISVPEINTDLIRIVLLQVAQSTALDFYLEKSQQLLSDISGFTHELESKGKLNATRKSLLKFIGRTINTKNRIIDDLYVIDSPPVVWENELLGKVNDGLAKTFDINIRYREIEYMLKGIEDTLAILIDLVEARNSHTLEWIIIILILIEVVDMVITKFI